MRSKGVCGTPIPRQVVTRVIFCEMSSAPEFENEIIMYWRILSNIEKRDWNEVQVPEWFASLWSEMLVAISLKNSTVKLTCIGLSFPVTRPTEHGSCAIFHIGILLLTQLSFCSLDLDLVKDSAAWAFWAQKSFIDLDITGKHRLLRDSKLHLSRQNGEESMQNMGAAESQRVTKSQKFLVGYLLPLIKGLRNRTIHHFSCPNV